MNKSKNRGRANIFISAHKTIFLSLLLFPLIQCSANLLNRKIDIKKSPGPQFSNYTASVSSFRFSSVDDTTFPLFRSEYEKYLKESIANSIYNTGIFRLVNYTERKTEMENGPDTVYFDVSVTARDDGEYVWGVTWPAVYPCPLVWPFQERVGNVKVEIKAIVFRKRDQIKRVKVQGESEYSVELYAFYRTSPIEKAAERACKTALAGLTDEIRKINQELQSLHIKRLAVLVLDTGNISSRDASLLTDKLLCDLARSGKYEVLERSVMEKILQEQGFQQTGCVASSCKVKAGRLLGVTHLLAGTVGRIGDLFHLSLRVIDVENGEIVKYLDGQYTGGIDVLMLRGIPDIVRRFNGY